MARRKRAKHYSGIGGQAVLEGIMMKNKEHYAVAVRKPDGEIEVEVDNYLGIGHDKKITKLPFIRGVFSFIDSLVLGMRCLNFSASFYEDEEARETIADKALDKVSGGRGEGLLMGITTIFSFVAAIAIFMILPFWLTSMIGKSVLNQSLLAIIEGVVRIAIFVLYVLLISLMKDIRRVYMYHGAEHKCINCLERGRELTVRNVMKSSKQHRRCGTSFLLFVMLISVVLFFFIRVDNMALKVLLRILLIPVIAGIAYEVLRLAGRSENIIIRIISAPGMWLQALTTREPDEAMVEVAIAAVEAVFDWKKFLTEEFDFDFSEYEEEEAELTYDISDDVSEEVLDEFPGEVSDEVLDEISGEASDESVAADTADSEDAGASEDE